MEDDLLEDDEISFEDDGFGQQDVEHVLLDEDGLDDNECLENNVSGDNELEDEEDFDNEVSDDEHYHKIVLEDDVEYVVERNDENPLITNGIVDIFELQLKCFSIEDIARLNFVSLFKSLAPFVI